MIDLSSLVPNRLGMVAKVTVYESMLAARLVIIVCVCVRTRVKAGA